MRHDNHQPRLLVWIVHGRNLVGVTAAGEAEIFTCRLANDRTAGVEYPFELTVESSSSGIVHSVDAWLYLDDAHGFGMVKLDVAAGEIFKATRIDPDDPWVQWAVSSLEATSGKKTAVLPNLGGSLPNDIFTETLGLKAIWVPHSYPGCSQHAPNEHLPPALLREALGLMAGLYWDMGSGGTPRGAGAAPHAWDLSP